MKYSFNNDYSEGAFPAILEALAKTNTTQSVGYGFDEYCECAKKEIQNKLQNTTCDIHFLVGGTQANTTVIAASLRPYEAVIAVESGHINVHETGAIEASGHKVVCVKGKDGKMLPQDIRKAVALHEDEHMVKPAMVYISNATEIGTIYTKQEIIELSKTCRELGLYLFMDGARLGAALSAKNNDLTFSDLCNHLDVFYIGGTKNGALFGEAVVINHEALKKDFRYMIKQHGGMLAKGRLLGIQFQELMKEERYLALAKHANDMAQQMQKCMKECGISFYIETTTNQIFPILPNTLMKELQKTYVFQKWEVMDQEHTALRFVTSWATPQEAVTAFCEDMKKLTKNER